MEKTLNDKWILYGSELSPFTLKLKALFDYREIPYKFLFTEGNFFENIKAQVRKERLVYGFSKLTWPERKEGDEYPLVPFVFGPNGENLYDSSAIAYWLDQQGIGNKKQYLSNDPAEAFLIALIEEYMDEFGLYMVHHNRWKVSAIDNNAGARLGYELRSLIGPLRHLLDKQFSNRQTRRLPYLFSVAPNDYSIEGLSKKRQPPSHQGFPATHDLLEQSFKNLLSATETILTNSPYLLGSQFTLADASFYGQLAINLFDPSAAKWIEEDAPNTYAWLMEIQRGQFKLSNNTRPIDLTDQLKPLLKEVIRVYVPLMQQNYCAYQDYKSQGKNCFNEKAFNKNESIYSGEIDGIPFKSVAKSFQANTWEAIQNQWLNLNKDQRTALETLLPKNHNLYTLSA